MAVYIQPQYEASEVNSAARRLVANELNGEALDPVALSVVNNWRTAHDFPLNGIHMTMKGRAARLLDGSPVLSAQRIKRLDSILLKLRDREQMKFSQMQDIGGCRIILPSVRHVYALQDYYSANPVVHEPLAPKDYINDPVGDSGYRSLHLKFRFRGRGASDPWDGLKIEMQVRTERQHRWATAVEAAGTLKGQLFKSRRGDEDWRRYFHLASTLYADLEGTTPVPNTPHDATEAAREMASLDQEHKILTTMASYSDFIRKIDSDKQKGAHFFVMHLDPVQRFVQVWEYRKNELAQSSAKLEELEQSVKKPAQVVRVSVSSLKNLRRAYPNYFLDTRAFIRDMGNLIRRHSRQVSVATTEI
jgi:Region found in RelA / SpoT proteins